MVEYGNEKKKKIRIRKMICKFINIYEEIGYWWN